MYKPKQSENFKKILIKLRKKDKTRYDAAVKKIRQICCSRNVNHYKNLKYSLKNYKRVHIDSHFVIIFSVDKKSKVIIFEDLQHHDKIYDR